MLIGFVVTIVNTFALSYSDVLGERLMAKRNFSLEKTSLELRT